MGSEGEAKAINTFKKSRRATEKAPDQDMHVSGGQFQGILQSAIQESPNLVGKPESKRGNQKKKNTSWI